MYIYKIIEIVKENIYYFQNFIIIFLLVKQIPYK